MKFLQDWRGRILEGAGDPAWFTAHVPGNIQHDYGMAHGFGDPNEKDHFRRYLPLEDNTWEYETTLSVRRAPEGTVWFVSEGIDYRCDILLNGELLLSHEGMYETIACDLTDRLRGKDRLSVRIYPHPKRKDAPAGTRDEADRSCKPPVCYGWDWNPRLLISGMWQPAYIETRGPGYIGRCEPFCTLDETFTQGTVRFDISCDRPCTVTLQDAEGEVIYHGTEYTFQVEHPHLWWCNGQGEPYLYTYRVESDGDRRTGTLAFRHLRIVRNTGAGDPPSFPMSRYAAPTTVELNGRRIFAKGSNWVNPELFWGTITETRYDELLQTVADAHMNLLRVWGGAGINKPAFYDLCDRKGILIWQEFMLACNQYPDSADYLAVLEREATAIITSLRRHPCLALWCGGNELFNTWSGMDDQSLPLRLLDRLCYELDPGRPFFKTSPLIGMAHGCYAFRHPKMVGCDVLQTTRRSHFTAYTEFGVPALTDMDTLQRIIPESEQSPPRPTDTWRYRNGFGAWGENTWICDDVLAYYFGAPHSLDEMVEQSNRLQCIGYQCAFEEMRRQWPHCAMALNWCYNEPWSNAGNNCLVDYPTRPRPAYEAVKRALRGTLFSAGIDHYDWKEGEPFEADIWLLNDTPQPARGAVRVELIAGNTTLHLLDWNDAETPAGSNLQGPTVHCILPVCDEDFFTLRLIAPDGMENSYTLLMRHADRPTVHRQMNA